jgi:hypothetical protein
MLLPQYSIRKLLIFVTLFAVWCWLLVQAFQGVLVAQAFQFGVLAWVLWMMSHLAITSLGYFFMRISEATRPTQTQSPFAHETEAPQILPPREIPLD